MKKDDLLDFMEELDDKYLEEAGLARMHTPGTDQPNNKLGNKLFFMNINKWSIIAAALALIAGIGIGVFFINRPVKGEESDVVMVDKYTNDGELILPKGTPMTPDNAIVVPKDKWDETGLTDPSKYEALPGGFREIVKIYKWNVETDEGYNTYYSVIQ